MLWLWLADEAREGADEKVPSAVLDTTEMGELDDDESKEASGALPERWEEFSCSGESNDSSSSDSNESNLAADADDSSPLPKAPPPPPPEAWPHRPVFARLNPHIGGQRALSGWAAPACEVRTLAGGAEVGALGKVGMCNRLL